MHIIVFRSTHLQNPLHLPHSSRQIVDVVHTHCAHHKIERVIRKGQCPPLIPHQPEDLAPLRPLDPNIKIFVPPQQVFRRIHRHNLLDAPDTSSVVTEGLIPLSTKVTSEAS